MEEQNNDWQPPPPPRGEIPETTKMSLMDTLLGVFFEPGNTFSSLRIKPRFFVAGLIILLSICAFQVTFIEKFGYANIVKEQMRKNTQFQQMTPEQQKSAFAMYENPILKYVTYAVTPIFIIISMVIGALIYWGGIAAFGGSGSFLGSLAGWVYASLPPTLLMMLGNFIILFVKSADEIDLPSSQQGLVQANLGLLVSSKDSALLHGFLSGFDIFIFFGMFLGAIALQKIGKISAGSAWTITIILWLITLTAKIVGALMQG